MIVICIVYGLVFFVPPITLESTCPCVLSRWYCLICWSFCNQTGIMVHHHVIVMSWSVVQKSVKVNVTVKIWILCGCYPDNVFWTTEAFATKLVSWCVSWLDDQYHCASSCGFHDVESSWKEVWIVVFKVSVTVKILCGCCPDDSEPLKLLQPNGVMVYVMTRWSVFAKRLNAIFKVSVTKKRLIAPYYLLHRWTCCQTWCVGVSSLDGVPWRKIGLLSLTSRSQGLNVT